MYLDINPQNDLNKDPVTGGVLETSGLPECYLQLHWFYSPCDAPMWPCTMSFSSHLPHLYSVVGTKCKSVLLLLFCFILFFETITKIWGPKPHG